MLLTWASEAVYGAGEAQHVYSLCRHHTSVCPTPVILTTRYPKFSSLFSVTRGGSFTKYSALEQKKKNALTTLYFKNYHMSCKHGMPTL